MYDPMVAKLIVWDADREQATRRMLRALGEYEIGGLKTLIPFHQALLATEQWAKGETCRDLLEDRKWLKTLAFAPPAPPPGDGEEEAETVEQTYAVEVSGRRFDVRVVGPPFAGGAAAGTGAAMNGSGAATGARKAPKRGERKSSSSGGPDTLPVPPAGQHVEGARQAGRQGAGGAAAVHHRGDEDGERDHRAQGRHDRRASHQRGRSDSGGRADRDDQERRRGGLSDAVLAKRGRVLRVHPPLGRAVPALGQLCLRPALHERAHVPDVLLEDR